MKNKLNFTDFLLQKKLFRSTLEKSFDQWMDQGEFSDKILIILVEIDRFGKFFLS